MKTSRAYGLIFHMETSRESLALDCLAIFAAQDGPNKHEYHDPIS